MPESQQACIHLPVFDISQPLSPSSLSSLSLACKEWGFFHIINHGVSKNLYKKLYSLSNHLFSLPCESKIKVGPSSSLKSYTPHFIASPFFESLRVSGPDFHGSAQSSAELLFDHPNLEFSETLKEYGNKMSELSKRIVKAVLMSLGEDFDTNFYESDFSNCHGYMRINNYTAPESVEQEKGVEGLGMHTDMSCVTIVCQDEIGGLQVRSKEGKWMDINPCEDTLVVNIGDLMHAWSNGKLRSSEHRVVLKRYVNRFSLAFFWCFEDEKVILAPNEVVGEGNFMMYKPFVCRDYLKFRESCEKGKFDTVGFTVKDFAGNGG
ncbi:gibberellin 20-oxidase-like protein [Hevea brasiliensis]|uniref:gibberellin 20-oxidase-like protein n=1 Tax=Hevea brasiliensis TaxID=3981 RepID=UPI0025E04092|nr:gibberellin 20-oxidase-like protein [Hevea brasiliensis]